MYLTVYWNCNVYGRAKPWPCSPVPFIPGSLSVGDKLSDGEQGQGLALPYTLQFQYTVKYIVLT